MKMLGFDVWRCQIDKKQQLQQQAADKSLSDTDCDNDSENDVVSVSSTSSHGSVEKVIDELEKTILADEEVYIEADDLNAAEISSDETTDCSETESTSVLTLVK